MNIVGKGDALLQNEIDKIEYEIYKKKNEIKFNTKLKISKNLFNLDILNYKKNKDSDLELIFLGKSNIEKGSVFNKISLKEEKNIISIENLSISSDYKINELGNVNINYIDKEDLRNNLKLTKKDSNYLVSGNSFNIKSIIDELLDSGNDNKFKIFNKNFRINFDVKKIYLNKNNTINTLKGFLFLNKNEISELELESNFYNN